MCVLILPFIRSTCPFVQGCLNRGTTTPTFKLKVIREIYSTTEDLNGMYFKDGAFRTFSKKIPVFNQQVDVKKNLNKLQKIAKKMLNLA